MFIEKNRKANVIFCTILGLQAPGEFGENRQDHRLHHHRVSLHPGILHPGLLLSAGQGLLRSGPGPRLGAGKGANARDFAAGGQGEFTKYVFQPICQSVQSVVLQWSVAMAD